MTVKEFLSMYNDLHGTGFAVYEKDKFYFHVYCFQCNEKNKLIEQFGDRMVREFAFTNESTPELDIYL